MFCANCGKELKNDSKFCPFCGKPVKARADQDKIKPSSDKLKTKKPEKKPEKEPKQDFTDKTEKSKSGFKTVILGLIIIFAVLIILIVVGMGIFVARSGGVNNAFDELRENGITGMADVMTGQVKDSDEDYDRFDRDEDDNDDDADRQNDDEKNKEDTNEDTSENTGDNVKTEKDEVEAPKKKSGPQTPVDINVRQVDNSEFPKITFYANVLQTDGNSVQDLTENDFSVQEVEGDGNLHDVPIDRVYQVLGKDRINIDLVLDMSSSMTSGSRMDKAKSAATTFLNKVDQNDRIEVIAFNEFVYLEQSFTSNFSRVSDAINGLVPDGDTAIYDALYSGIYDTYYQDGAKCVIGFTDGEENASSHTFEEVVELAQSTGIPVFIIGLGDGYDASTLSSLAAQCSGEYYEVNDLDIETVMENIYSAIYRDQQDYYVFEYSTPEKEDMVSERAIILSTSEDSEYKGQYRKPFMPTADLKGGFSSDYANKDYMIPESSSREVTEADLQGMSLAELRIARNEIFARRGRQFKDPMLNKWFYSKQWYLSIPQKYSPSFFDSNNPNPLSKLENNNANFIMEYEKQIMDSQSIFPDASTKTLSEYDVALSKEVLKRALQQMEAMGSTPILQENIQKVKDAINAEQVSY